MVVSASSGAANSTTSSTNSTAPYAKSATSSSLASNPTPTPRHPTSPTPQPAHKCGLGLLMPRARAEIEGSRWPRSPVGVASAPGKRLRVQLLAGIAAGPPRWGPEQLSEQTLGSRGVLAREFVAFRERHVSLLRPGVATLSLCRVHVRESAPSVKRDAAGRGYVSPGSLTAHSATRRSCASRTGLRHSSPRLQKPNPGSSSTHIPGHVSSGSAITTRTASRLAALVAQLAAPSRCPWRNRTPPVGSRMPWSSCIGVPNQPRAEHHHWRINELRVVLGAIPHAGDGCALWGAPSARICAFSASVEEQIGVRPDFTAWGRGVWRS